METSYRLRLSTVCKRFLQLADSPPADWLGGQAAESDRSVSQRLSHLAGFPGNYRNGEELEE